MILNLENINKEICKYYNENISMCTIIIYLSNNIDLLELYNEINIDNEKKNGNITFKKYNELSEGASNKIKKIIVKNTFSVFKIKKEKTIKYFNKSFFIEMYIMDINKKNYVNITIFNDKIKLVGIKHFENSLLVLYYLKNIINIDQSYIQLEMSNYVIKNQIHNYLNLNNIFLKHDLQFDLLYNKEMKINYPKFKIYNLYKILRYKIYKENNIYNFDRCEIENYKKNNHTIILFNNKISISTYNNNLFLFLQNIINNKD